MAIDVTLAVLADYANVSQEGKLNICGVFSNISAFEAPLVHPQMHVILIIESDSIGAAREHKVEVELIDADGARLLGIAGKIKFPTPPSGAMVYSNQIMKLNNVRFENFGRYEFKVLVDDEIRKSIPLSVVKVHRQQA